MEYLSTFPHMNQSLTTQNPNNQLQKTSDLVDELRAEWAESGRI
jgi:hypothetical protein